MILILCSHLISLNSMLYQTGTENYIQPKNPLNYYNGL